MEKSMEQIVHKYWNRGFGSRRQGYVLSRYSSDWVDIWGRIAGAAGM